MILYDVACELFSLLSTKCLLCSKAQEGTLKGEGKVGSPQKGVLGLQAAAGVQEQRPGGGPGGEAPGF